MMDYAYRMAMRSLQLDCKDFRCRLIKQHSLIHILCLVLQPANQTQIYNTKPRCVQRSKQ